MAGGGVYPLVDIGAGAGLSGARPSRGGSVDPALGPLAAVPDRRHLRGWAWRRHRIAGERPAAGDGGGAMSGFAWHGGRLAEARAVYGGKEWIDLSTGISPFPWPGAEHLAVDWRHFP